MARLRGYGASGSPIAGVPISGGAYSDADQLLTLTCVEQDDLLDATTEVVIAASLSATEADDTLTAAAAVRVLASATITEADDTPSAAAGLDIVGDLGAHQEDDDVLSATMSLVIAGELSSTEEDEALVSAARNGLTGQLAGPRRRVSSISTGPIAGQPISGGRNVDAEYFVEDDDVLSSSGVVSITATLSVVEQNDTLYSVAYDNRLFTSRARVARQERSPVMIARQPKPIAALRPAG